MEKISPKKQSLFGKISFAILVLFLSLDVAAQTITASGQIFDSQNGPLIGVSVLEKGTSNGTVSDVNGRFSLNTNHNATLIFSYIGYLSKEAQANSNMSITLRENNTVLDEVVVVGYGSVKRKDVTTAVSSVSAKDMDMRPIVSAAQMIQGKAAGVTISQPNGAPGADMTVRVRGTTSFNGSNSPLYVVDGVPVDNIGFIAPNDIENIQILKDASSASIYGSRAANGVVIISTKSGQHNNAKITINAQMGINKINNKITPLNAIQYDELMLEIGGTPYGTGDMTNWNDEIYQTGISQNYQLAISNGNEKMKYYISAGYLDNKGIIKSTFYKRYNFRVKVDNKIRKWLDISTNIAYSDYSNNGVTTGQPANRGGLVLMATNLPTAASVRNPDGSWTRNFNGLNVYNPAEAIENGKNNSMSTNRILASGHALITFMPGLTLKSSISLDRRNSKSVAFRAPNANSPEATFGTASDIRTINTLLTQDNVLTYKKDFKKHSLEIMAGSSWTHSDYSQSYLYASHYRNDLIHTLNAANKIEQTSGSTASQWGIMSFFGRVAYNFDSKYLLTMNIRSDGSSKLNPDHRWGVFPSLSAAWRISAESFMENTRTWLDDLKIRGGWGQTGNQSGVGDYSYLQTYSIVRSDWTQTGHADDLPGIQVNNLRNKDLTWETTTQTNIGLDLSLFNYRLSLAADYYHKRTSDMLMYVTLPSGQAASSIIRNEGEMTNQGFEFAINSHNLTGEFKWDTDFNISFNRNRLEKLALQQVYYGAQLNSEILREYIVRNEPGRPIGGFYGYECTGVDPQTGALMYADHDGKEGITPDDYTYIGDPNPDFTFGMTNRFSWKNLSLSIFMQGTYGNDIYNASRIETESMSSTRNQSSRVLNRWHKPGDVTDMPKAGTTVANSSYYIEDGSYLRIKDITLSYDITGNLLRKLGVTRLQPYFTATNLITFTKYSGTDPEVNEWGDNGGIQGIDWGTYPFSKSFVFGVNIEF